MKKKCKFFIVLILLFLVSLVSYNELKKNNVYEQDIKFSKNAKSISMNLEQTAGAGDYKTVTQSNWPTEGYKFNKELSRCENGGELSWDKINKTVVMIGSTIDKCYVYFDIYVPTLTDYVVSKYTGTQGENGIYYHDGNLENGAGDNSYRYAGANPNNYVCFGTDSVTCPTDNLYRIIGVFDDKVKLIKYDYATKTLLGTDGDYSMTYSETGYSSSSNTSRNGLNNTTIIGSYYWNKATVTNTWSESNLNKINLNTNFISNIGEEWASKIAPATWKVGGGTSANILSSVPSVTYQYEVGINSSSLTYDAKIALIYVSDYEYAAGPSAWTLVGWNSSDKTKDYSSATGINWMYTGFGEWTISPYTDDSGYSYFTTGMVLMGSVGGNGALLGNGAPVRPAFYLNSSAKYLSGDGSVSSPIRIS